MAPEDDDRGTAARGTGRGNRQDDALDARVAAFASIASVTGALRTAELVGDPIGVVLRHVEHAVRRFETAPGPLTRQVVAADLLDAYRILRDRERAVRRGARGELLKAVRAVDGSRALVPWTPARPVRLEDVAAAGSSRPFFGSGDVQRWLVAVSYRPPAVAPGPGRRAPAARRGEPFDSTGVHPFHLTYVQGRGKGTRRTTLPWPLSALVIPNAYRIELMKRPGMSFLSREGRIAVLAYLLEVLAEGSGEGEVFSSEKSESVAAADLARHIVETAAVGIGKVLFEGPESAFRVFERAPVGYVTDFVVTDELIQILWYYTDIKPKFRSKERPDKARGCGSIEWITELLKEVPHRFKETWIQDRMMNDRAVYPDNLEPGLVVPAKYFLTEKVAEALGGEDHQVVFVGSFTANDRIIKTEDGRVWLVKEHERNVQAFCQAVIQLQGILTLSFIFASAIGAVLGGPLVGFLITAGDVAIDVNQAGGIRKFLKGLKKDPLKAGLFMLDLVTTVGDVKGMRALLTNPQDALEASIRAAESGARAQRALPAGGQPVDRAAGPAARGSEGAGASGVRRSAEGQRGDAAGATTRPTPASAPVTGARGAARPTDPPRAAPDSPPRTKEKPDVEVDATDPLRGGAGAADQAVAGTRRRSRPSRRKERRGPDGTVRTVRHRRPPGGGEKSRGLGAPGSRPLRGNARRGRAVTKAKDPLQTLIGRSQKTRAAVERLERLGCGVLAREVAEEVAGHVKSGRKLLERIATMADDEIRGLAAVRRALEAEPVVRSHVRRRPRGSPRPVDPEVRSTAGKTEMDWLDVLDLPQGVRGDLLRLVGRVESVTDAGLSQVIATMLSPGRFSIQGALGHLHAAATIAERYRGLGVRMVMELPVVHSGSFRVVDIRATVAGTLRLDVEVKTYLGQLTVSRHVEGQIVKDLVRHVDDGWEGLRYVFAPQVGNQLDEFRRALLTAFDAPNVQRALREKGIDPAMARRAFQRRLDDTGDPMVAAFAFTAPG